jgi:hypothetical protein
MARYALSKRIFPPPPTGANLTALLQGPTTTPKIGYGGGAGGGGKCELGGESTQHHRGRDRSLESGIGVGGRGTFSMGQVVIIGAARQRQITTRKCHKMSRH